MEVIDRLCIPKNRRSEVLGYAHNSSHFAVAKTYALISIRFFWPGMYKDTVTYCRSCEVCLQRNSETQILKGKSKFVPITRKNQSVHLDLISGFVRSRNENVAILVMTDAFTKWIVCVP